MEIIFEDNKDTFPRISGGAPARVNSVKEKFRRKGSYIDELLKCWR